MSDDDAICWALIAMAYATTKDIHTGGTIRARRITEDGVAEEISKSVLQIYLENYEKFTKVKQQIYYEDGLGRKDYESWTDSTIFLLRHPYKILSHDDMMDCISEELGGSIRYRHTWGQLGHTRLFELTTIVLDGEPQEAYKRVQSFWVTANAVKADSRKGQRPKEPTYKMGWLKHEGTREFILVGRGDDGAVREKLLEAYS